LACSVVLITDVRIVQKAERARPGQETFCPGFFSPSGAPRLSWEESLEGMNLSHLEQRLSGEMAFDNFQQV
jgi:hypothetical protein